MKETLSSAVATAKQYINTAWQWLKKMVAPVTDVSIEPVVAAIHRFRTIERQTPGEYTVSRSVGSFLGGYLGAMLALSGSFIGFVLAVVVLVAGGYLWHLAGKYQPQAV
jgi:hypothetical protein